MVISFQKILLHDIGQSKVHPDTARYSAEKTRHVLYFVMKCKFMENLVQDYIVSRTKPIQAEIINVSGIIMNYQAQIK